MLNGTVWTPWLIKYGFLNSTPVFLYRAEIRGLTNKINHHVYITSNKIVHANFYFFLATLALIFRVYQVILRLE